MWGLFCPQIIFVACASLYLNYCAYHAAVCKMHDNNHKRLINTCLQVMHDAKLTYETKCRDAPAPLIEPAIGFDRGTVVPVCWRGIQSGERGEKDKRAHKACRPIFLTRRSSGEGCSVSKIILPTLSRCQDPFTRWAIALVGLNF